MPKQKNPAPCSAFEFALRRRAIGLDNATLMALTGCSISSATKWTSGAIPVAQAAYDALCEVERAVDTMTGEIVRSHPRGDGAVDIVAEVPKDWKYGDLSYEIAVAGARFIIEDASISPPPSA